MLSSNASNVSTSGGLDSRLDFSDSEAGVGTMTLPTLLVCYFMFGDSLRFLYQ